VVCATDDKELNGRIATDCAPRNLLVNAVDQPELCNFLVPAVVRRGDLTIAVSTGGKSPLLARRLREELEGRYGEQYEEYLDLLAELRRQVLRQAPEAREKQEILESLVSGEILALLRDNRMEQVKERLNSAYRSGGS
jgi:precorrin-2 dehydrogenase/sirohydrochlorin ferrochelatase